jgi:hypothetical protein
MSLFFTGFSPCYHAGRTGQKAQQGTGLRLKGEGGGEKPAARLRSIGQTEDTQKSRGGSWSK